MAPWACPAPWAAPATNPEHSSRSISSLLVATHVADDIGDIFVAFLFVGDESRIVIVIIFDGLIDLDVIFRFRDGSPALSVILLGVGFLQRNQLLRLDRLPRCLGG